MRQDGGNGGCKFRTGAQSLSRVGDTTMTGKPRKPGDDQTNEVPQPNQHEQGNPNQNDPANFGNIDPEPIDVPE